MPYGYPRYIRKKATPKRYQRKRFYRGAVRKPARYGYKSRAVRMFNGNQRPEELKYFDIANNTYNFISGSGAGVGVTLINPVTGGSTVTTRVGNQMIMKSIEIQGKVQAVDDTIKGQRCDIYVIYDKTPGAALPVKTDIFKEEYPGSPMNLDYRERFVVIAHAIYTVGGPLTAPGVPVTPTVTPVSIRKVMNLRTTYKSVNAAIGDIAAGALYMVLLGEQNVTEAANFTGNVRLRFAER